MDVITRIRTELAALEAWARVYQKHLKLNQGDTTEQSEALPKELADCGASWPTVRGRVDRALRKAGVLKKRPPGRPEVPVEVETVLRQVRDNVKKTGRSKVAAVAKRFGISRQTVYRMLKPTKKRVVKSDESD